MSRNHRVGWGCLAGAAAAFVVFCVWAIAPLASPPESLPPTRLLFRDGSPLYDVLPSNGETHIPVTLGQLPSAVLEAIVAAEDERFYDHAGVDLVAMLRALSDNARAGEIVSGASTIEQQVVKNAYFVGAPRSMLQKVREAVAAFAWARTHDKRETLETYVNVVPFGSGIRGVGMAAQTYFHAAPEDLNVSQAAMLAGIIAAPSAYDPVRHTQEARDRQAFVLDRLVERGSLTADERAVLRETRIPIFAPTHPIKAPHAAFRILDELERTIPAIREGGYVVQTTLDPELQSALEQVMMHRLSLLDTKNVSNAAAVAIDPVSRDVRAYVGSANYFNDHIQGRVDMATALRQPGSALKPFVYLLAFLRGIPPSAPIADTPVRFVDAEGRPYEPRNYNYRFNGPVALRDALGSSLNVPAVKLLDRVGLNDFFNFLSAFRLTFPESPEHYGLGIVLGGGEVTLYDVTNAYASLAREGYAAEARMVLSVQDRHGKMVFRATPVHESPVHPDAKRLSAASRLLTDVLSDKTARFLAFGEGNLLDTGTRIAVKTGTTHDFRDNWAFGYTPDLALGVWVGNADNHPMDGVSGITGAVPIWADIMRERYRGTGDISWDFETGLTVQEVCTPSGLLASDLCQARRQERFIPGTEPTRADDWYVRCKDGRVRLSPPDEYRVGAADGLMGCDGEDRVIVILSPREGDVYVLDSLVAQGAQGIPFTASRVQERYIWHLDGQRIEASQNPYLWKPVSGTHTLELEGATGDIRFFVEE